jgi:hypothetical protein
MTYTGTERSGMYDSSYRIKISFEVAKLKQEDKFGRTHTCYFQTKNYTGEPKDQEPQQAKKADKKKSKKQPAETGDDLPF